MVLERHCHSDTQFPRCWAKLTDTDVRGGRCETATALLARPRAPFRMSKPAPEPIWRAPVTRDYTGYFEGAIARLKAERRYRSFVDLERISGHGHHPVRRPPRLAGSVEACG